MEKYDKIYVLAPYNHATGGIELAHQLVDYLRRKNKKAFICYVGKQNILVVDANVTEAYRQYDIAVCSEIEDKSENIVILPEIYLSAHGGRHGGRRTALQGNHFLRPDADGERTEGA